MTKSRALLRHLVVVLALALVAAACGGDDPALEEPTEDGATETGATPTEDTTEPTEATEDESEPTDDGGTDSTASVDGVLTIGTVLPETGDLAFLGPPMIAAVQLAVQDINEAGGILGQDVVLLEGDSGDGDGTVANQTVDRHLAEGADIIFGAAASGISLTFIDKVTGAGVIQISPSNTAATFTDYDDDGFYFRTAPSDSLQGPVLADQLLADGASSVAILARSDDYGRGLAEATQQALEDAGGEVVAYIVYDHQAQNFDAEVAEAAAANPDAVVLVGFDESARILQSMIEAGIGPDAVGVYGVDGNRSDELAPQVNPENPGVLAGMRGTSPAVKQSEEFVARLMEFAPDLSDTLFAGESYDAIVITALAAAVAGTDDPAAVAQEINDITREGGTECSEVAECLDLIEQGEKITYSGALGILNFQDAGEPGSGTYDIWEVQEDGSIETVDTVEISI